MSTEQALKDHYAGVKRRVGLTNKLRPVQIERPAVERSPAEKPNGDLPAWLSPTEPISIDFVEEVPAASADDIIRHAAWKAGLTVAELKGCRRNKRWCEPRQFVMWRLRNECTHMSLPMIGRKLGGRDHTTVLHGWRKVEALMKGPVAERDAFLKRIGQL